MPDEHSLPDDAILVRTTVAFDESTVPAGLLRAHRIAEGVWGRLVVQAGTVTFRFEDNEGSPHRMTAGSSIVIPPSKPHHVSLDPAGSFVLEFYRRAS